MDVSLISGWFGESFTKMSAFFNIYFNFLPKPSYKKGFLKYCREPRISPPIMLTSFLTQSWGL